MLDFTKLEEKLTKLTTVSEGTAALLGEYNAEVKKLASQLKNPADQAKLNELADAFGQRIDSIGAAVEANTPAVPAEEQPAEPPAGEPV